MPTPLLDNRQLGPDVARANLLTNGGLEIWQRGNGPFNVNGVWAADRWRIASTTNGTVSASKDTSNADSSRGSQTCAAITCTVTADANAQFYHQFQLASPSSGGDFPAANLPLSLSIRVRTATANAVRAGLYNGSAWTYTAFHTGDGTYQTLTVSVTMLATGGQMGQVTVSFALPCTAYIDNAMLVVGSQAADYVPLHPADDLARCLRYYQRLGANAGGGIFGLGQSGGASAYIFVPLPARMAVAPTVTISATADFSCWDAGTSTRTMTSGPSLYSINPVALDRLMLAGNAPNLVAGNATWLVGNNANAFIGVEANP